jgi:hypothetical protein
MLSICTVIEATTGLIATSLPVLAPILRSHWHELKSKTVDCPSIHNSSSVVDVALQEAPSGETTKKLDV